MAKQGSLDWKAASTGEGGVLLQTENGEKGVKVKVNSTEYVETLSLLLTRFQNMASQY